MESILARWKILYLISLTCVLVCFILSLCLGAIPIPLKSIFAWMLGNADTQTTLILSQLRLPRALLGMSVGALLAVCGTATQGLFRNPLADPSLIGVSAGAAAGSSFVIVLFSHISSTFLGLSLISLGAFLGGVLVVVLVYRVSTHSTGTSVSTMLLSGLAFTFLAGSISSIFEFIANNEMLRRISLWRMGGLDTADYTKVCLAGGAAICVFSILYGQRSALNALLLGESEARHLGLDVDRVKKVIIVSVAAGVAVSVAVAGTIVFVGLIVPHMVRMMVGPNHRFVLPLAASVGATVMLVADIVARTMIAPTEIPVGLLTSFIGVPVFLSLLRHKQDYRV